MSRPRLLMIGLVPLALLLLAGRAREAAPSRLEADTLELRALLESRGALPLDDAAMRRGLLEGLVLATDDVYSKLQDPEARGYAESARRGRYAGMGIFVHYDGLGALIRVPFADGPAARAGLQPEDRIVAVDGERLGGLDMRELRRRLRGAPHSVARVRVYRARTGETFEVDVTRAVIERSSVAFVRLLDRDAGLGYLAIERFHQRTTEEFVAALAELDSGSAGGRLRGLVLDLRRNGGGVLGAAMGVADRFLGEVPVVHVRGRAVNDTLRTSNEHTRPDLRLVVLIDRATASAAEVLAGALQDHGRALLVGERSFGKASVQRPLPLSDGGALHLTIARYLTPAGRRIHRGRGYRGGIAPDLPVHLGLTGREALSQRRMQWTIDDSGTAPADAPRDEGADPVFDIALAALRGERPLLPLGLR